MFLHENMHLQNSPSQRPEACRILDKAPGIIGNMGNMAHGRGVLLTNYGARQGPGRENLFHYISYTKKCENIM